MVWKGFPAFPAHLRMRPVSGGNSRLPWVPSTCASDLRKLLSVPVRSQGHCGVGRGQKNQIPAWARDRRQPQAPCVPLLAHCTDKKLRPSMIGGCSPVMERGPSGVGASVVGAPRLYGCVPFSTHQTWSIDYISTTPSVSPSLFIPTAFLSSSLSYFFPRA